MTRTDRRRAMVELLRTSVRGRRPEVVRVVVWSAVATLPVFLSGRLVATAIDDGFLAGDTAEGLAWLALLAASAVVGAFAMRQSYLVLARLVEPFRDDLARSVVRGTLWRSTRAGAVADGAGVARLTQQVEIAREAYASVLLVVQGFAIGAVGALLGLLTLAPVLLLFVVPPVAVGLALFAAALPRMAVLQRSAILADERLAEDTGTVVGGLRDVTAAGGEAVVAASLGRHVEAQAAATRALARFTAVRTIAVAVGGWLPIVLILAAGPWLLRQGQTTGSLLGALTYVSQGLHGALQTLVRGLGSTGLWLVVTLGRIVEAAAGDEREPRALQGLPDGEVLRLSGVTFGYGRSPRPIVAGLDLVIAPGDHLAIVGPSGIGKSTLANLAAGLLDPDEGEITTGGVPLARLRPDELARHRVLIPQETYVFAGTLWENVTYLRPDADRGEVDRAVEALGLRPLADRLGGLDAEVAARDLSAGERQLVTLVRAYLAAAPLAVLDEATCHLDPEAEAMVEQAFSARGGALIVIAHRISSALRAQRILVLDGDRATLGTHDELLETSELYRDLIGHWHRAPDEVLPTRRRDVVVAALRRALERAGRSR